MKKISFLSLFFLLIFFTADSYAQDFNLYNPSNEIYLFSAYDEGANAFRYNPAVLGLGHRLNAAVNIFLKNHPKSVEFDEFDFLANAGSFGFSYRFAKLYSFKSPMYPNYDQYLHTMSFGIGFGNKTFSGGLLGEWQFPEKLYTSTADFDQSTLRFRAGTGFLYRPYKFLSTAFTVKTKQSFDNGTSPTWRFTYGVAARPMLKDMLTFMLDFSNEFHGNYGFFQNHMLKLGVDFKPANGFHLFGNFTRINSGTITDYVNLGVRFDFPNFSARYTNSFNKFTERDNSFTSYKSAGQNISLSFNLEKRKSIVRQSKKIFELTLSGSLQDYSTEDVFFGILGKGKRSIHEIIADIDYAAGDESISGMLLKIYPVSSGMIFKPGAAIEELTGALERFKKTGKKITAYFPQDAGPSEYYIATFADNIVIPDESIFYYGLTIDVINYKQFLEKYGVELQNFSAGKYKLTFQGLLDSSTAEGKEVINNILDIVYDKMLQRVKQGRNLTIDDYLRMKLSQPLMGREAKRLGLADENGWYQDAKDIAIKESGTGKIISSVNRSVWDEDWSEPDRIAIIGVYSSITTGESRAPDPVRLPIPFLSGGRSTGSESVVKQLEDAFADPKVKAVILRVDSGGGSALASAEINAAIVRLKRKYKKPFIVSMGGAAASGGYYVSVNADKIFSDELTITGSIGVWTSRPNLDSLLENQKIKIETYKRGENSDIGTLSRSLDPQEKEIIQGIIDFYYDRFIEAVSEGRNLTKEEARQVAQGRVWLGTDAFNKGLVDQIGGLYEAVKYAKQSGKLGNRYKLVYYAVPGGDSINEIITTSMVQYIQSRLINLAGFGEENGYIDIKY